MDKGKKSVAICYHERGGGDLFCSFYYCLSCGSQLDGNNMVSAGGSLCCMRKLKQGQPQFFLRYCFHVQWNVHLFTLVSYLVLRSGEHFYQFKEFHFYCLSGASESCRIVNGCMRLRTRSSFSIGAIQRVLRRNIHSSQQ
jgi:hypothetical protein